MTNLLTLIIFALLLLILIAIGFVLALWADYRREKHK